MSENAAESYGGARMSETTTGGGSSAVRLPQTPHGPSGHVDLAMIQARHVIYRPYSFATEKWGMPQREVCLACRTQWPCDAAAITARLAAVEAERDAARRDVERIMGASGQCAHNGCNADTVIDGINHQRLTVERLMGEKADLEQAALDAICHIRDGHSHSADAVLRQAIAVRPAPRKEPTDGR